MGAISLLLQVVAEQDRKRREEEHASYSSPEPTYLPPSLCLATHNMNYTLMTRTNAETIILTTAAYGPCQYEQYERNGVGQVCSCEYCSLSPQYGGRPR